ncbi:hypothetical protein EPUS_08596 [Endocarpon pusillum Z07020]|uniref:DNA2/NAM7 helicase-like C-terminal domain-containing protein n=1 Tax=Endocarpon pusillum (strain Z07020 / HMAS-L-300199) TaxID=1263415 RepID=U1HNC9_ENDPU|nr:uncharacterized protein EPUS_08596 [Endocarpon pusillum Z07020]ERF70534.1 hypothetical protein EPUS_08596 [Endocarpon pusillum Z07020]
MSEASPPQGVLPERSGPSSPSSAKDGGDAATFSSRSDPLVRPETTLESAPAETTHNEEEVGSSVRPTPTGISAPADTIHNEEEVDYLVRPDTAGPSAPADTQFEQEDKGAPLGDPLDINKGFDILDLGHDDDNEVLDEVQTSGLEPQDIIEEDVEMEEGEDIQPAEPSRKGKEKVADITSKHEWADMSSSFSLQEGEEGHDDAHDAKRMRQEFQPMPEEDAMAIAVGRSKTDAIKRLEKGTSAAAAIGLKLKREAREEPVDESTLAVLEEGVPAYRDCPKAISVPCLFQRWGDHKEFGGVKAQHANFSYRLRIDFGRYGRPSIQLTIRRSKVLSKPLDTAARDSYYEVKFKWQPGCVTDVQVQVDYGDQDNETRTEITRWMIESMMLTPFMDDRDVLIDKGLWQHSPRSQVERLSDEDKARLVALSFNGRHGQIETNINVAALQLGVRDPPTLRLLGDLFGKEDAGLTILFLVPDYNGVNPNQTSRDAYGFMHNEFSWFKLMYDGRWPPDHPYLDDEHELNITLDMRDISTFKNRMYVVYSKDVTKRQNAQKQETGVITYWPEPHGFYTHDLDMYYHSVKAYCIPLMVNVVRSWQWERPAEGVRTKVSEAQDTRMKTFYVFVWLPKDNRLRVPADQSPWHIEFAEEHWGHQVHQPKKSRWTGYVRNLTHRELMATGASFVLACNKPRRAQWVESADDCTEIQHYQQIRMTQIVSKESAQRVLASVREFAELSRDDLEALQMTLAYDKEVRQEVSDPLHHGHFAQEGVEEKCVEAWHKIVKLLAPQLDEGQLALLTEGFQHIYNRSKIVLGGAGCKKTTTFALAAVIMGVSEDDHETAESVACQKYLRFVPPASEKDALVRAQAEDESAMHVTGTARDPNYWHELDDAVGIAQAEAGLAEAMANDPSIDHDAAAAKMQQILLDWERLKADYDRMAEKPSRANEFPVRHSLPYAIQKYEHSRGALLAEAGDPKTLALDFRKATDNPTGVILDDCTVVGCTYVSSAHELMNWYFKPSVVFHEEASRAKLSTVKCALIFRYVKAHIFLGDIRQLKPFDAASHVSEFNKVGKMFILDWLIQKKHGYTWLKVDYRNHPDILQFPNREWYENLLESAPCVYEWVPQLDIWTKTFQEQYSVVVKSQYYCINVPRGISQVMEGGTSLQNFANAEVIACLCLSFVKNGMQQRANTVAVCVGLDGIILVTIDQYQGEDNDFVILDLTATQKGALFVDGEPMYQEATSHLTSENRLCTALTRAKYGCAIVGAAQSLERALANSEKGTGLVSCIHDAIDRGIMITDLTEDESNYVQDQIKQGAGYRDFMAETAMDRQYSWMASFRQSQLARQNRTKRHGAYGRPTGPTITYPGPDQGKQFQHFPPLVRDRAKERQAAPNVVPSTDKQETRNTRRPGSKPSKAARAAAETATEKLSSGCMRLEKR